MRTLIAALPLLLLSACATQVTHPTKSKEEMQADIKSCTDKANHDYWMDPIAALLHAYDCLEAMGYRKGQSGLEAEVKRAVDEGGPKNAPADRPCQVPCRRER